MLDFEAVINPLLLCKHMDEILTCRTCEKKTEEEDNSKWLKLCFAREFSVYEKKIYMEG